MNTLEEALARERLRETAHYARTATLAHELAAQRRWHRVARYARAAEARHAARADQAATVT